MKRELTLRIVLERPPAAVDFGLQKGRGSNYETVQTQRSEGREISFEFAVEAKAGGGQAGLDFAGLFVQGPRGGRFVYVDIGTMAGQPDTGWTRRMKIPLSVITTEMAESREALEVRVPGTGKDGGPACGTCKRMNGWKPASTFASL